MTFKLGNPGCPCCDESDPPSEPSDSFSESGSISSSSVCIFCVCDNSTLVVYAEHFPAKNVLVNRSAPPTAFQNCLDGMGPVAHGVWRERWSRPAFNIVVYAVQEDQGIPVLRIPDVGPPNVKVAEWTFQGWERSVAISPGCIASGSAPSAPSPTTLDVTYRIVEGTGLTFERTVNRNTDPDNTTISAINHPKNCGVAQDPPIYIMAPGEEWDEF